MKKTYRDIREIVIEPSQLKPTYVFTGYTAQERKEKRKKTRKWLNELYEAENIGEIPPVTAVRDPDTNELLIYDGNIRVSHATQNNYKLRVRIISDQNDMNIYIRDHGAMLPFGMTDFKGLIEDMRQFRMSIVECRKMFDPWQEELDALEECIGKEVTITLHVDKRIWEYGDTEHDEYDVDYRMVLEDVRTDGLGGILSEEGKWHSKHKGDKIFQPFRGEEEGIAPWDAGMYREVTMVQYLDKILYKYLEGGYK